MNTSDQGRKLIAEREGVRHEAYPDVKGIWTIGVGHTGLEVRRGLVWTDQQIDDALKKDLATAEGAVNLYVKVPLQQDQFDALVSFIFNVGVWAFYKSTMLRKLNQGDYEGAAAEFDKWHIPDAIITRRNGERDQFKGIDFVARK